MAIVQEGQNLFDVTTEQFGTLEELFTLLIDNDLPINTRIISGQELVINKIDVGDEDVKNFVVLKNITMNNAQGLKLPPLVGGDYNNDYGNDYY